MSDVDVLPPGKAIVRIAETTAIEQAHDPARAALDVLSQARQMLDQASRDEDIDLLIDMKDRADLIREWTVQKKMGLDLELAAAEFVRRTERAIGKAIRAGQERGEIRTAGQHCGNGRAEVDVEDTSISPAVLVPNSYERRDAYAFADETTDEEFEEVLAEAKAEENLSRANVKRKVDAKKGKPPKPAKRPDHLRGTHHIDPNRVVAATVLGALVDDTTFELLEGRYSELDRDLIEGWVCSLSEAIKALTKLKNNLKKEQTQ